MRCKATFHMRRDASSGYFVIGNKKVLFEIKLQSPSVQSQNQDYTVIDCSQVTF